jgi:hypothetical protein
MRRTHLLGLALLTPACADAGDPADQTGTTTTAPPATTTPDPATTQAPAPTTEQSATTTGDPATSTSDSSDTGAPDGPPTLTRIGDTFDIPTLAATMPKRFADAAHDPVGDVYLVVNTNAAVSGSFLDADGAPLAQPFALADTAAYTQGVRVAFGGAAFLVAWHDNRDAPNISKLRGRLVAWDGAAHSFISPDLVIGGDGTYSEMPPAIAWSASSQQFMIVWHTGDAHDLHARRVAADGALVGDPLVITADPDWQSDAGLAWNAAQDQWLVVYTHAGATTEVRARRLAADGAPLGPDTTLTVAPGTWLAQVAWLPETGGYLATWFEGAMMARRLTADALPDGDAFALAPGYGSYDGFAVARNPTSGRFAAVFHGDSDEDFALAFDLDGAASPVIMATDSPGADGHFNPHIAAHSTRREWLLVTSLGFASVVGQRLGE